MEEEEEEVEEVEEEEEEEEEEDASSSYTRILQYLATFVVPFMLVWTFGI